MSKISEPLVSIIIPTRNRKDLLLDAIEACISQTYKNLQIIIHDNNSIDWTSETVAYFTKDSRVQYFRSPVDLTMTENWNSAFKYVKWKFFVRLDDDNVFAPNFIQEAIWILEKEQMDAFLRQPLVVAPNKVCHLMFDEAESVYVLNPRHMAYLEYYALSDSNYFVYKTSVVRSLLGNDIYRTTLPDRFLNYAISWKTGAKIGFQPKVAGITRFDYRSPIYDKPLKWVDYSDILASEGFDLVDCHNNFPMHRVRTLDLAIKNFNSSKEVANFCEKRLLSEKLYLTQIKVGHVYQYLLIWIDSLQEFSILMRYTYEVSIGFFRWPFLRFERSLAIVMFFAYMKNVLTILYRSACFRKDKLPLISKTFWDWIVKSVILGNWFPKDSYSSLHGSFEKLYLTISR